jgi:hypothetical protein
MTTIKSTIAKYIKDAKKRGTVKMTLDNLFMCCPVAPVAYAEMAGTNGRYVYKQEFFKIAAKHFPSFII